MNRPKSSAAREGALIGAHVWFAYGVVETLFAGLVPFVAMKASTGHTPGAGTSALLWVSPTFTLFALVAYAAAGAAVGAAAGFLAGRVPTIGQDRRIEWAGCAAAYAVLLAFAANAIVRGHRPPLLLAGIGLLAVSVRCLWRLALRDGSCVRHLAGGWSLALLLAGGAYLLAEALPATSIRIPLGTLYGAAVLLAGMAAARFAPAPPRFLTGKLGVSLQQAVVAACVVGSTILIGVTRPSALRPRTDASRGSGPSVVVIVLDSVGADHLRLLDAGAGGIPNLQRLAAQSTVYTRAISSSNQTLSTHASLFTGLRPTRHLARPDGVLPVGTAMPTDVRTLPELLAARGYETCGVAANSIFMDASFGFARGFDRYDSPWLVHFYSPSRPYLLRQGLRDLTVKAIHPPRADALFVPAPDINAKAAACVGDATRAGVPFFLFLNYMDAHAPYLPPPPFDTRHDGKVSDFAWERYAYLRADVLAGRREIFGERERRHLLSQYQGAVEYLDQQLGHLIDDLRSRGRFDDSLIVVTSDHGEAFGQDGVLGHGVTLHDHQVHVPLLVKYPRGRSPGVRLVSEPVSTVDLLPTILDVVGAPAVSDLDGISLRRLEARPSARPVLAESFGVLHAGLGRDTAGRSESAVFRGNVKIVRDAAGGIRVYDVASGREQPQPAPASADLVAWLDEVLSVHGERVRSAPVGTPERDILRSLGYIGR